MDSQRKLKIFLLFSGVACPVFLVYMTFLDQFILTTVVPTKIPSPVDQFHRNWPTNCSALFSGDERVIEEASKMLQEARKNAPLPLPTDKEVQHWTVNCSLYRSLRQYPTKPGSDEEAAYPIAYSIIVHKDSVQLERLLRAIYHPQNIICIHPDKKSPQDFLKAIRGLANCFENVFVPSKLDEVEYGGIGMVMGDINCMIDLTGDLGVKYKWNYLINLCGQDFPLKTNLEIVRQLKAYKGHNDIHGDVNPPRFYNRLTNKGKPPHNLILFKGGRYIAASRPYVEFVVNDPVAKDMLKWVDGTFCPEEFYWVTLHRAKGTPGGYPLANWDSNARFVLWDNNKEDPPCVGKFVRAVCIFTLGYLRHLAVMPHIFANKFYYNYDPVTLQCLEEALNDRTLHPEKSDKIVGFPVTTFVWQNYTEVP